MAAADTIMTSRVPYPSNHARTPSTLKFLVSSETMEEDVKDTVNFRRVQELFSVNMSVCSDGEGYDVVSLTGSDADRIEKARVSHFIYFLFAFFQSLFSKNWTFNLHRIVSLTNIDH